MAAGVIPSESAWKRTAAAVRAYERTPDGGQGADRKKIFSFPADTIPVALTIDGTGTAGDGTTAASFTYTVTDLDGNAITDNSGTALTGISPAHNRPIGKTTAAAFGTLGRKADGSLILYQTDECPGTVKRAC